MSENPLLAESTLLFRFPHFDRLKDEHFLPAFETGMAEQRTEIDRIACSKEDPTFENTIVALECSGSLLDRVSRTFFNLNATHTGPELQRVELEVAPKLAAHRDAMFLNMDLFRRIDAVHNARQNLSLDAESLRLLDRYHTDFIRAGAQLSDEGKALLRSLNSEIAVLQTTFAQNVLKEMNACSVVVEDVAELEGMSGGAIETAKQGDKYVLRIVNTTGQPVLSSLKNRDLRRRIFEVSMQRNSRGGEYDNREILSKIAKLRAQRAALLGFPHHAAFQIADHTSGKVENVHELLTKLVPAAVDNAHREASDLQSMIQQEGQTFQLAPWDWDYYAEKVRLNQFQFDSQQVRPYFEMNSVLHNGVFFAANKLFGLSFQERTDLPKYHDDTQVFQVSEADGNVLALFIVDWFARPTKRGGAWASAYVSQSQLLGQKPVVANHLNLAKPPAGQPSLLTKDEVVTAFHEFGHALHMMFSDVVYPRFSGTSVPLDFLEFPSQVYEMWADWPETLSNFAKHHETGETIPDALLQKMREAAQFNQGFRTSEYLAATLLDLSWHQLDADAVPSADDVLQFEFDSLERAGLQHDAVPPRYRSTYFSHIFSGNSYSAGYYSYIWAEVLDADGAAWFADHGGLQRSSGEKIRRTVLSRGGSRDAVDMYREFAGRDPDVKHVLARRGLV